MAIDKATGEVIEEEEVSEGATGVEDNVHPLRPPRRPPPPAKGTRRTTISGSQMSGDDARVMAQHSRTIEVEGNLDRLGLVATRETLDHSESARRLLTQDLVESKERHEEEVDRVRDEYERAATAAESRHASEARRWRDERDRLQRDCERLEREVKDAKKSKKKHKRSVQEAELALAQLRDHGESKRAVYGLIAPGVPPLATELARHVPSLFAFVGNLLGGVRIPSADDQSVQDRAAAIRVAGRLFDPQNELAVGTLEDLERLAFDVVHRGDEEVIVFEWDRVQRYIWSALRRESEANAPAAREVVDSATDTGGG